MKYVYSGRELADGKGEAESSSAAGRSATARRRGGALKWIALLLVLGGVAWIAYRPVMSWLGGKAASVPASPTLLPPALLPPSLGRETPPIPAAAPVLDRDPDLLDAPEDLPDASPAPDFTLKTPRSIK